ncbi:MAG TPA: hypothetical protein PKD85_21025 [Saprospiraceae bacterium]|nr:hypothetical protein [Saprospiraceae bacterium]
MNYVKIAKQLIKLRNVDLECRSQLLKEGKLSEGYNEAMQEIHEANAHKLNAILDKIGYPTEEKVGKEASESAWMIIQHAISLPSFMRKCADLLENAVAEGNANKLHLASLQDRIAILEGQPQRYGTQFDWDENGVLNPNPYDDVHLVNERRNALGLCTLEEQTQRIRERSLQEGLWSPIDLEKRKDQYEEWRSKVGWNQ